MKKFFKYLILLISYIYCLGYIIFDYPTDTYLTRAIRGIMSTIFSISLWYFLLRYFDKQNNQN